MTGSSRGIDDVEFVAARIHGPAGDFPDEALEDLMRLDQLAQRRDHPTAMMAVTEIGTLVRPLADVRGFAARLV